MVSDLVPSKRGVDTSRVLTLLSFVLPYVVTSLETEDYSRFKLYAPFWIVDQLPSGEIKVVVSPIALIMFLFWLPYVAVAFFSYNYASAKYNSTKQFMLRILVLSLFAVALSFTLGLSPLVSSGGRDYYPTVIPLPLTTLFAVLLVPLLRPKRIESPWGQPDDSDDTLSDGSDLQ